MHLSNRPIRDADGDGVEDNEKVSSHWMDKHARYVFGRDLDNMHNTHNGEVPGHTNIADSPEPKANAENVETEVDLSWNYGDIKPVELLMTHYIDIMQSPDDLQMLQTEAVPKAFKPRMIYDLDGDGVQDNREDTADELDKFYIPMVFFPAEEMHNTHHGNLPGHISKYFDEVVEVEPANTYDLVSEPWTKW